MNNPDRYADSGRAPLLCPITAPNGRTFLIGEFDSVGIYLWCRWCRKAHFFPFSQLQASISLRADASACLQGAS